MSGKPLFCDPDLSVAEALRADSGGTGTVFTDLGALRDHLVIAFEEDTIVLGTGVGNADAFAVADYLQVQRPSLSVIMVRNEVTIALLQEAMSAGVREVVPRRDALGLQAAVKRSANRSAALRDLGPAASLPAPNPDEPYRRGRVVTVFSAKGGCGKTTLATNLAAALADAGRREVCIVDLDLAFGDVAIALQLYPVRTIADAVPFNGAIDSSAVAAMLTHHSGGLSAIVAPTEPSTSETIRPELISHLLDVLRNDFDYIVVDTRAAFDDEMMAALDVSDVIALIVTPDVPALKTLKITLETLIELRYPVDKFRLVLNRSDAKVGISHAEVEKTAQMPITGFIPSSRDIPMSINRGVAIVQDDPRHPVSLGIRKFAETELIGSGLAGPDAGDSRSRLRKRRGRA
jgi:pilus assembly protein CpaE